MLGKFPSLESLYCFLYLECSVSLLLIFLWLAPLPLSHLCSDFYLFNDAYLIYTGIPDPPCSDSYVYYLCPHPSLAWLFCEGSDSCWSCVLVYPQHLKQYLHCLGTQIFMDWIWWCAFLRLLEVPNTRDFYPILPLIRAFPWWKLLTPSYTRRYPLSTLASGCRDASIFM